MEPVRIDTPAFYERLETVLLESIDATLGTRRAGISNLEAVLLRIRAVFEAPLASEPGSTIEERLTARVQRALAAGLTVAAAQARILEEVRTPRVVVRSSAVRAPVAATDLDAAESGPRDSDDELWPRTHEPGVLVLTDVEDFGRIRRRHACVIVDEQHLQLHAPRSTERGRRALAKAASGSVHVYGFLALPESAPQALTQLLGPGPTVVKLATTVHVEGERPSDVEELAAGTLFHGKYEIVRCIGHGGFGSVYEARDARLGSRVAIKLLNSVGNAVQIDEFIEEARRVSSLEHPNIVGWKVFDQDENGCRYFVMELLEGEELGQVLKREQHLSPKRTARILLQIADALRAAHHLPDGGCILHLDLKPKNVFVLPAAPGASDERVKVIDFGIGEYIGGRVVDRVPARAPQREPQSGGSPLLGDDDIEQAGNSIRVKPPVAGATPERNISACTPEYASPEQCSHLMSGVAPEPVDGRSDIYSLGVLGFRMLTGELPFRRPRTRNAYLRLHREVAPDRVRQRNAKVPRALAAFVDRCLEKDPARRWRDAHQAYEALERIVHPSPARLIAKYGLPPALLIAGLVWALWPSAGLHPLDVYVETAGREQNVAQDGLWLGPARATAQLRIAGLVSDGARAAFDVVQRRDDNAPQYGNWSAQWLGNDHVVLARAPDVGSFGSPVYLRATAPDGTSQYSAAFELDWVGENAWSIERAEVSGLGDRRVDPRGQSLEVQLRDPVQAVATLEVEFAEKRYAVPRVAIDATSDAALHRLSLETLPCRGGINALRVIATDRAGRESRRELRLDVVLEPLTIAAADLQATRVGERFALSPGNTPLLDVRLNRAAAVDWIVVDSTQHTLAHGASDSSDRHAITLPAFAAPDSAATFSGWIEVRASDAALVSHALVERGHAERRLPFVVYGERSQLALRLVPEGRLDELRLDPGSTTYVNSLAASLLASRLNDVPIDIEIELDREGEAPRVVRRALVDPTARGATIPLTFAGDGRYHLFARSFRHEVDQGVGSEPEFAAGFELGVDTTAPRLVVACPDALAIVRLASDQMPSATIAIDDQGSPATATPVNVRWELSRANATGDVLRTGDIDGPVTPGSVRAFTLPLPWTDALDAVRAEHDGRYRVRFSGRDVAGNDAVPAEAEYDVALRGPALQVRSPAARLPWSPGETRGFEIEVLARDDNGVALVEGEVLHSTRTDLREPIAFDSRTPADAGEVVWRGHVKLGLPWSEADVVLSLRARDKCGASSELDVDRRVVAIEPRLPSRVRAYSLSANTATMALVQGNHDGEYVFGGRADADEEALFRSAGLGRWRSQALSRSWNLHYAPRAIGDFYLDEREVSVAEMRDFLTRADGWNLDANWSGCARPNDERRNELEAQFATLSGDLPATGVRWNEAAAYARSLGKRLPSYVEWEYAVRGGARYRPYSSANSATAPNVASEQPRSVEALDDVARDTGIRDLCGNVSEWTETPASFPDGTTTPRNYALHAEQWRDAFLHPRTVGGWDLAARYWVVGGSWTSTRFDFSVADRRRRDWSSEFTGFRCAASADAVMTGLESARQPSVSFEEVLP